MFLSYKNFADLFKNAAKPVDPVQSRPDGHFVCETIWTPWEAIPAPQPTEHDIMLYNKSLSCFVLEVGQSICLTDSERQSGSLIEYQGQVHKIDHINTEDYQKPRIYLKLRDKSEMIDGEDNGDISS
jgi:hypothetical protein